MRPSVILGPTWAIGAEATAPKLIFRAIGEGDHLSIDHLSGNVGIGTTSPDARFVVSGGDAAVTTQGSGLILKATDGANCYRITVNNAGTLSTTAVTCP
jgi:hypothetical protein